MQFSLSSLKFEDIRKSVIEYLQTNGKYNADLDYTGSNLSYLIDSMTYIATMLNYQISIVSNELFLDSCQIRKNAVSIAKIIGYRPKRKVSAKLPVTIEFTAPRGTLFTPTNTLVIPMNKSFTGQTTGKYFTNAEDSITLTYKNNTTLSASTTLIEGKLNNIKFLGTGEIAQKYNIPSKNVENSYLKTYLKLSGASDTTKVEWLEANTFINLTNSDQKIFFVEEDIINEYTPNIVFGDGVIGEIPPEQTEIIAEYIESNGASGNGEDSLTYNSREDYSSIVTNGFTLSVTNNASEINSSFKANVRFVISSYTVSYGGEESETLDSIKESAKQFFYTTERAITSEDTNYFIKKNFSDIVELFTVIGGDELYKDEIEKAMEENSDSYLQYLGNTYLSALPVLVNANFLLNEKIYLTDAEETEIIDAIKKHAVIATRRFFIKPTYIYVESAPIIEVNSSLQYFEMEKIKNKIIFDLKSYYEANYASLGISFKESKLRAIIENINGVLTSYLTNTIYFILTGAFFSSTEDNIVYLPKIFDIQDDGIKKIETNFVKKCYVKEAEWLSNETKQANLSTSYTAVEYNPKEESPLNGSLTHYFHNGRKLYNDYKVNCIRNDGSHNLYPKIYSYDNKYFRANQATSVSGISTYPYKEYIYDLKNYVYTGSSLVANSQTTYDIASTFVLKKTYTANDLSILNFQGTSELINEFEIMSGASSNVFKVNIVDYYNDDVVDFDDNSNSVFYSFTKYYYDIAGKLIPGTDDEGVLRAFNIKKYYTDYLFAIPELVDIIVHRTDGASAWLADVASGDIVYSGPAGTQSIGTVVTVSAVSETPAGSGIYQQTIRVEFNSTITASEDLPHTIIVKSVEGSGREAGQALIIKSAFTYSSGNIVEDTLYNLYKVSKVSRIEVDAYGSGASGNKFFYGSGAGAVEKGNIINVYQRVLVNSIPAAIAINDNLYSSGFVSYGSVVWFDLAENEVYIKPVSNSAPTNGDEINIGPASGTASACSATFAAREITVEHSVFKKYQFAQGTFASGATVSDTLYTSGNSFYGKITRVHNDDEEIIVKLNERHTYPSAGETVKLYGSAGSAGALIGLGAIKIASDWADYANDDFETYLVSTGSGASGYHIFDNEIKSTIKTSTNISISQYEDYPFALVELTLPNWTGMSSVAVGNRVSTSSTNVFYIGEVTNLVSATYKVEIALYNQKIFPINTFGLTFYDDAGASAGSVAASGYVIDNKLRDNGIKKVIYENFLFTATSAVSAFNRLTNYDLVMTPIDTNLNMYGLRSVEVSAISEQLSQYGFKGIEYTINATNIDDFAQTRFKVYINSDANYCGDIYEVGSNYIKVHYEWDADLSATNKPTSGASAIIFNLDSSVSATYVITGVTSGCSAVDVNNLTYSSDVQLFASAINTFAQIENKVYLIDGTTETFMGYVYETATEAGTGYVKIDLEQGYGTNRPFAGNTIKVYNSTETSAVSYTVLSVYSDIDSFTVDIHSNEEKFNFIKVSSKTVIGTFTYDRTQPDTKFNFGSDIVNNTILSGGFLEKEELALQAEGRCRIVYKETIESTPVYVYHIFDYGFPSSTEPIFYIQYDETDEVAAVTIHKDVLGLKNKFRNSVEIESRDVTVAGVTTTYYDIVAYEPSDESTIAQLDNVNNQITFVLKIENVEDESLVTLSEQNMSKYFDNYTDYNENVIDKNKVYMDKISIEYSNLSESVSNLIEFDTYFNTKLIMSFNTSTIKSYTKILNS